MKMNIISRGKTCRNPPLEIPRDEIFVFEAGKANIEPSMPRVVGRQQHRSNVEAGTPKDYYKRALTIPLLDHLISEIDTYFDPNNDAGMSSLLCLLPALLVSREGNPVRAAFQSYADDLPSPQVFDVELFRWRRKWQNADQDHLPSSAAQALEEFNHEFFPKVHKLLRILCTLPITSAEYERSFSTLRRLKTYLRATMTSEREYGLALTNIHYGRQIDISVTIDLFARKHPRRLLLSDILAE